MSDQTSPDRYLVQYNLYGDPLDIDALLAQSQPSAQYEAWHKGDARGPARQAKSSGIRLEVIEGDRPDAIVSAVDAFLERETVFLTHAARYTSETVYSVLSCAMWVYANVPTTIWLPSLTARRMSELGIGWEVTGYPCSDEHP